MAFITYSILILVIQISFFVSANLKNDKANWLSLFIIELVSIGTLFVYGYIYQSFDMPEESIFTISSEELQPIILLFSITLFAISVIVRSSIRKKLSAGEQKNFIYIIALIILCFIITVDNEKKVYREAKEKQEQITDYVINYLNETYGNKNYKILKIDNYKTCEDHNPYFFCSFSKEDAYKYTFTCDDGEFVVVTSNKSESIHYDTLSRILPEEDSD